MKISNPMKGVFALVSVLAGLGLMTGCSSNKVKNKAMESAAQYWQDKAYPGKSFDVQVVEAEKTDDGQYRVKGIIDGETRVGTYNPATENFSEGYYSLAHEREKRVAELEQESKYWKERADALEKENYKLKVQLGILRGDKNVDPDGTAPAPASASAAPADAPKPASAPKP